MLVYRSGGRGGSRRGGGGRVWCGAESCYSKAGLCEWDRTRCIEAQIGSALQLLVQPLPQGRVHSQQDPQTLHMQTAMTMLAHLCPAHLPPSLSVQVRGEKGSLLFD